MTRLLLPALLLGLAWGAFAEVESQAEDVEQPALPAAPDDTAATATTTATATATATASMATIEDALDTPADPLGMVAAQIEAGEFEPAERWLEAHVAALEDQSQHRYDGALIRPYTLLGDAHMGQGEHAEAIGYYQQAIHLTRVNGGLKSPEQVEIVYREADALRALGQLQEANSREEYAFHIASTNASGSDESLLPALYRLADWYVALGNPFAARELYAQATRILGHHDKLDSRAAVPALRGLARTYRLERFPAVYSANSESPAGSTPTVQMQQPMVLNNFPAGEQALQQIVRIEQEAENPEPIALVEAVLDLADWYLLFDKPRRANPLYAHAYELLGAVPGADAPTYFADPKLLYFPDPGTPRSNRGGPGTASATGFVEVAYEVTETGQVRNLATIASEPPGVMDLRVRRSLRVARYRPALVDGVPVARALHTYRHEFPYRAEPAEEQAEPATETAPAELVKH
ncbi:MAG: hypothetical protein KF911_15895 [Pseudomonadales bacterium]|nr:hypothetical protein [Pseudomonadales bacterium]